MTPPWRSSVYARVALMMTAVVGLVNVLVLVLMVVAFRVPGLFPGEPSLRVARFVAHELADRSRDPAARRAIAARLSDELDLDLTLVKRSGEVIERAGDPLPIPSGRSLAEVGAEPVVVSGLPLVIAVAVLANGGPDQIALIQVRTRAVTRTPVRALLVGFGALAVALAIALPFARSIARPIERLARASEALGAGDLSARSGIARSDEIGKLAASFDAMADRIEALRRGERELIANAAHELRTPMARIRVTLGLIDTGDPKVKERVGDMEAELAELDHLVSDVLLMSRIDAGALDLRREHLQARPIARRSAERTAMLDPARAITLDVPEDLYLYADEALLLRVLDNLLANAVRYDTSGAPIELSAREEGAHVIVAVTDGGPGIPEAEAERIFTAFFRGGAASDKPEGHGLGLALSKRIAEAHGGSIRVAARPDGARGARIEVALPLP